MYLHVLVHDFGTRNYKVGEFLIIEDFLMSRVLLGNFTYICLNTIVVV